MMSTKTDDSFGWLFYAESTNKNLDVVIKFPVCNYLVQATVWLT